MNYYKELVNIKERQSGRNLAGAVLGFAILVQWPLLAQVQDDRRTGSTSPKAQEASRRLQNEFDERVALGPIAIIDMLRKEPGLLLEAKKILIKLAFEEGRLLDESELSDESLFRTINEDFRIRALITREMTRRRYVAPLPTEEERKRRARESAAPSANAAVKPNKTGADLDSLESQQIAEEYDSYGYLASRERNGSSSKEPFESQEQMEYRRRQQAIGPGSSGASPQDLVQRPLGVEDDGSRENRTPAGSNVDLSAAEKAALQERMSGTQANEYAETGRLDTSGGSPVRPGSTFGSRRNPALEPPSFSPRHKPIPYADVPSLYDMYSQVPKSVRLERFGMQIFKSDAGSAQEVPFDLPAGADYVLGPGDGLTIELTRSIAQRLQRIVDREGRVALPEIGSVMVAGLTLTRAQQLLQDELRGQFRDVRVDLSLGRLRSVRVYVVGDVRFPGPYDISSLSSPLNAIFVAGGPTDRGSIRLIRHLRAGKLIQEVDTYDLILNGVQAGIQPLQSGDTIVVPPLAGEVTLEGMVRRPAIYELRSENTLSEVVALAGGILPTASFRHVEVERLEANSKRSMVSLDVPEEADSQSASKRWQEFLIQPGDKIRISAIPPRVEKAVYLEGHVFEPGKYAYREGMKVAELVKQYGQLLPEPFKDYAEIIRLSPDDFQPHVLAFNLGQALSGDAGSNLDLKPWDTVRVYGRFDFEDTPSLAISGEVRNPGEHRMQGVTRLSDAIFIGGGLTPEARMDDAQVIRQAHGQTRIFSVNLERALSGDLSENFLLEPNDRIIIQRNLVKLDPASVYIKGEVSKPGRYALGDGMTVSQLIRLAGGLKRGADSEAAELTRFKVGNGRADAGESFEVRIGQAATDPSADINLEDGDALSIRQLTGFQNIGAAIAIQGEVVHPTSYGIKEGERLSAVLARAGGFTAEAFPQGAVLERQQLREIIGKQREELLSALAAEQEIYKLTTNPKTQEEVATHEAFLEQQKLIQARLRSAPITGRMVIQISSNMSEWQGTTADIEVRSGDVLTIPKRPGFVMVSGHVFYPNAITYRPGKNARWYLRQGGGASTLGDKKRIFVVRANGSVIGQGGGSGWWAEDPLDAILGPGDMVFVPEKIQTSNNSLKALSEVAQIMSAVALTISVALK